MEVKYTFYSVKNKGFYLSAILLLCVVNKLPQNLVSILSNRIISSLICLFNKISVINKNRLKSLNKKCTNFLNKIEPAKFLLVTHVSSSLTQIYVSH